MSGNLKGALLALAAFGVFATHDVVVKVLGASYSPFQIVFFSVLFGFPLVSVMLIGDAQPGHLRPVHPWWITLRTLAIVVTGAAAFYAFSTLPLAQVYAILFATPLMITLLSIPILGERVRLRRWVAVLIGLAGVLVVLRPGSADLSLGHLAALGAAVGSAFASIIVRKIGRDERNVVLMLYPLLANFAIMGALMPFVYAPMPILHLMGLAAIAVMAFAAGLMVIWAYKTGEAGIVAPMQYSQILWATVYGTLFFGETLDLMTALGAAIIIGSGLYIVLREQQPGASTTRPVLRARGRINTGTYARLPNDPKVDPDSQ